MGILWIGWSRDNKRSNPRFVREKDSKSTTHDACIALLEQRYAKTEKGRYTIVAIPDGETPNHGPLPFKWPVPFPPYAIVQAAVKIKFTNPEDSIWLHTGYDESDEFLTEAYIGLCRCGIKKPELKTYAFTYCDGSVEHYAMAQCTCGRCHWEEAQPKGAKNE